MKDVIGQLIQLISASFSKYFYYLHYFLLHVIHNVLILQINFEANIIDYIKFLRVNFPLKQI